jgi:hypothetical protein
MNSNGKTDNTGLLAYSTALLLGCMLVVSNAFADEQVRAQTVAFQGLNVATGDGAEALVPSCASCGNHGNHG